MLTSKESVHQIKLRFVRISAALIDIYDIDWFDIIGVILNFLSVALRAVNLRIAKRLFKSYQ